MANVSKVGYRVSTLPPPTTMDGISSSSSNNNHLHHHLTTSNSKKTKDTAVVVIIAQNNTVKTHMGGIIREISYLLANYLLSLPINNKDNNNNNNNKKVLEFRLTISRFILSFSAFLSILE